MKYNQPIFDKPRRTGGVWLKIALLAGAGVASLGSFPSPAAARSAVRELRTGQRVLMLLPLGLGEGWNLSDEMSQDVLPAAEQRLRAVLNRTGRFSLIEGHRFSPLLMRAVQERRVTQAQVDALLKDTTIGDARVVLSKMGFEQAPFIADYRMVEVQAGGTKLKPTVQVTVTVSLEELGGPRIWPVSATSKPIGGGSSDFDRIVMASEAAFEEATSRLLTSSPAEAVTLTRAEEPAVAKVPARSTPASTPKPPTSMVPAPGPVPIPPMLPATPNGTTGGTGMPQLPAPEPPLGIAVPDAATVAQ